MTIASLLVSGVLTYGCLVMLATQIGFTLTLAGVGGVIEGPGGTIGVFLNLTKAPYNDVNFRKGVSLSLNRTTIAQKAVNGYTGAVPANTKQLADALDRQFPDAATIDQLTDIGVRYVVVHAGQYPAGGADAVEKSRASGGFRLLARFENDYLFEIE